MITCDDIRGLSRKIVAWIATCAVAIGLAGTTPVPLPVDGEMVERAVSGAEWLAARTGDNLDQRGKADGEPGLIGWLIVASGATQHSTYEEFSAFLGTIGYRPPAIVVQRWMDEFRRVLAADLANRQSKHLRTPSEIEADIRALPNVPLDDAGAVERDRLLEELMLATVTAEERRAVAQAAARISALRAMRATERFK